LTRRPRIGVDFDNTIVSYDEVFHAVAVEWELIPESFAASTKAIRDRLRSLGREDDWTRLQGHVYGPGMSFATPFPGMAEFFERCNADGIEAVIISHRTRWPYLGPRHDLHAFARAWLAQQALEVDAHFELTKRDKLARIERTRCSHFIDDLPEFLSEPSFPAGVARVLFDPAGATRERNGLPSSIRRLGSWKEITAHLLSR
jgi:hypothetical protein